MHSLASMQQEMRVIIYIDILGFKNFIVDDLNTSNECILQDIFKNWKQNSFDDGSITDDGVFKNSCTYFSDTIVISWPISCLPKAHSLCIAVTDAISIQHLFLQKLKLLTRGVIHVGMLYHNNPTIYGKGLIEAYKQEKDEVKNPKIIISKQAEKYFSVQIEDPILRKELLKDKDSCYYLNFLYFLKNESIRDEVLSLKQYIEDQLREIKDDSDREKWLWLANYFNEVVISWHSSSSNPIQEIITNKL